MTLNADAKKMINETKPAFVATADASGLPNVSAKGSTRVFGDDHILFADVASPRTVKNLKENPKISIIWLDTAGNASCRVWGSAEVAVSGDAFNEISMEFASRDMKINHAVLVKVESIEM